MKRFADLSDEERIERYERLARAALSAYGLAGATLICRAYTENVVFEVNDAATPLHGALRICRPTWDSDALDSEASWLSSLSRDTDLRIPRPIPTLAGENYCVIEEDGVPEPRACALFSWVDGEHARPQDLTRERMRRVGEFLAALHTHAETFRLPQEIPMERVDAVALEKADFRKNVSTYFNNESDLSPFDRAIEATVGLMRELGDDPTAAGIIHGDFHQRNYVFDGERVGAVDFETMWWGYYLYDLATTLSYLVPEFLGDVDPDPLREGVVEGYLRSRLLPEDSPRMLAIFSAYRTWIMADWVSSSPRMLEHDWARRRLDAMPRQIAVLLGGIE